MVCIVVTRNGSGEVLEFADKAAARLHPIPQMDDVYASDPDELAEQYGREHIDELLRFAEGRDRARLTDAAESWRAAAHPHSRMAPEARQLLWSRVLGAAKKPPSDPAEIVRIVVEDRASREGRSLRSLPGEDARSARVSEEARRSYMSDQKRAARIPDNGIINITLADGVKNPKREGTPSHERFALYRNGMTVAKAKEKGVRAADLSYDEAKGFIRIDRPAPAAAE